MTTLNIAGRRVTVDDSFKNLTPEQQNATVEEIARTLGGDPGQSPHVKASVEAAPDPRDSAMGKIDTFMRGAADTMSFGLADEIAAGGDALLNPVFGTGKDRNSLSDRYSANLEAQRGVDTADGRDRFGYRLGGQFGGAIGGGLGLAKSGLSMTSNAIDKGAKLANVAKASAAEGAILGAGQGFGSGEGGFLNRLASAGQSGVVGGALGLGAPYVTAGVGAFLRSVLAPVAARVQPNQAADRAMSAALERSGRTPDEIAGIMQSAIDDGQRGYAVADALGHAGQRMLSSVARTPNDARQEVVNQLLTRQAGQGDRLSNAVAEGFNAPDTALRRATDLSRARDTEANQLYGAARQNAGAVNVTPILETIDQTLAPGVNQIVTPRDRIANDSIEGALARVRSMISDGRSQVTDFNTLFRAKLDLDDMITKAEGQGAGNRAHYLNAVKHRVDQALSEASPAYRQANDTFARRSSVIDAVETGKAATSGRQRSSDTMANFNAMTPEQQAAFRTGYADPLIARIEAASASPTTNKARMLNTPKFREEFQQFAEPGRAPQLGRRVGREQRMFETLNQAVGGSRTADNMADFDDIANFDPAILTNLFRGNWKTAALTAVTKALNEGKGLPPRVIERVGRSLIETDPEVARRLLTVANSKKMDDNAKRGMATAILNTLTTSAVPRVGGGNRIAPLEITVPVPIR